MVGMMEAKELVGKEVPSSLSIQKSELHNGFEGALYKVQPDLWCTRWRVRHSIRAVAHRYRQQQMRMERQRVRVDWSLWVTANAIVGLFRGNCWSISTVFSRSSRMASSRCRRRQVTII